MHEIEKDPVGFIRENSFIAKNENDNGSNYGSPQADFFI